MKIIGDAMHNLDWPQLIADISEAFVLTQLGLGKKIGTTQQSISNWLNGRRVPSAAKAKKFFELAEEAGIDPEDYGLTGKTLKKKIKEDEIKSLPLKVRRLCHTLSELHPRRRRKVMNFLEDMLETFERKN